MSDRLVTVATFHESVAAAMAKDFLEGEGISAWILDESELAHTLPFLNTAGGAKLQVAPADLERAEFLLERVQAEKDDTDDDEEDHFHERTAIATREIAEELEEQRVDREPINQLTDRLFRATIIGLLFFPLLFYAVYVLLQICSCEGTISRNRRWKIWVSVLLDLPLVGVILYWLSEFVAGRP